MSWKNRYYYPLMTAQQKAALYHRDSSAEGKQIKSFMLMLRQRLGKLFLNHDTNL